MIYPAPPVTPNVFIPLAATPPPSATTLAATGGGSLAAYVVAGALLLLVGVLLFLGARRAGLATTYRSKGPHFPAVESACSCSHEGAGSRSEGAN